MFCRSSNTLGGVLGFNFVSNSMTRLRRFPSTYPSLNILAYGSISFVIIALENSLQVSPTTCSNLFLSSSQVFSFNYVSLTLFFSVVMVFLEFLSRSNSACSLVFILSTAVWWIVCSRYISTREKSRLIWPISSIMALCYGVPNSNSLEMTWNFLCDGVEGTLVGRLWDGTTSSSDTAGYGSELTVPLTSFTAKQRVCSKSVMLLGHSHEVGSTF